MMFEHKKIFVLSIIKGKGRGGEHNELSFNFIVMKENTKS